MTYDELIFNRFSGPAAIISYYRNESEIKLKTLLVNDKYLSELGMNIDEEVYLKADPMESFDDIEKKVYLDAIQKCINKQDESTCEAWRSLVSDCCGIGKIYVSSRFVFLEEKDDAFLVYETIRNITPQKKAMDVLQDSDRRYRLSGEQLNIYNWEYTIANKEMRPCYRCMRDLGLPALVRNYPEPAIEMGIFPPDYADMYREMMRKIDSGVATIEADIPLTVGRIPFRVKYTTEFDEIGTPVKAFGSATLISETELRQIRLDNNIIEALAEEYDCIYLADFETNSLKVIKQDKLFDLDPKSSTYSDLARIFFPKLYNVIDSFASKLLDVDYVRNVLFSEADRREFTYRDDEENRWVRIQYQVVERLEKSPDAEKRRRTDEQGETKGQKQEHTQGTERRQGNYKGYNVSKLLLTASVIDELRTQRMDALRLIAAQKKELEERQALLLKAVDEANRANSAKTTFFSNMSHDIRTPMSAIIGFSRLALEEIDNRANVEDYLEKIISANEYLLNLINDILDMSRIESGKMELSKTPSYIKELCLNCAEMIRGKMEEKKLIFRVDMESLSDRQVYLDRLRFRQILLNLLSNACKFTPEGGTVSFKARWTDIKSRSGKGVNVKGNEVSDPVCEIRIKDSGIGMSPEFKDIIWEAFSRDENNTTVHETQGTGLGMTIVKNIVRLMHGKITLESELGKGSECIIVLPMELTEAEKEKEKEKEEQKSPNNVNGTDANNINNATDANKTNSNVSDNTNTICNNTNSINYANNNGDNINNANTDNTSSNASNSADSANTAANVKKGYVNALERNYTGKTVLVVDDMSLNRKLASRILSKYDFTVIETASGINAIEIVKNSKPGDIDLILMDVKMPIMDGLEACRKIRGMEDKSIANIPIIAMTANAFESDIEETRKAGMNAHVSKPFTKEELITRISENL